MVCLAKKYEFRSLEHSQTQNHYIALNLTPCVLNLAYDNGCMLNDGTWSFTWNGENRLIIAESANKKLEFTYDYMGRRIEKKIYSGAPGNWTLEKHLRFVYDGYSQVEELDALDGNSVTKIRVWEPGGNRLLSTTISGTTYYAITDANKNITEYVDSTGSVHAHFEYSPFGKITSVSGINPDAFDFRFSSEYYDVETGLVYYNFRYYSPELGRWMSRDPIGERGGMNIYAMANNNALNGWDRLGQDTWSRARGMPLTQSGRILCILIKLGYWSDPNYKQLLDLHRRGLIFEGKPSGTSTYGEAKTDADAIFLNEDILGRGDWSNATATAMHEAYHERTDLKAIADWLWLTKKLEDKINDDITRLKGITVARYCCCNEETGTIFSVPVTAFDKILNECGIDTPDCGKRTHFKTIYPPDTDCNK